MRNLPLLFLSLFVLGACSHNAHDHAHGESAADSANALLNEKVMDIHDDVMGKADILYRLKKKFQDSLSNEKTLSAEVKTSLESKILSLDSASGAMEKWMHEFNPEKDSADQEKSREYLESEIEKINRVKAFTEEVIEKVKVK